MSGVKPRLDNTEVPDFHNFPFASEHIKLPKGAVSKKRLSCFFHELPPKTATVQILQKTVVSEVKINVLGTIWCYACV